MSAFQVSAFLTCLLIGLSSCAISPLHGGSPDPLKDNSVTTEAPWAPATQPREFSYNVMDNIQGANQIRQESWNNGTMSGMYAYPYGPKQWQIVHYIADTQGFRVTSTEIVDEAKLMGGHQADAQTAEVDIDTDGTKSHYKVKASEIGQKQKQQQQSQQKSQQPQQKSQEEPSV